MKNRNLIAILAASVVISSCSIFSQDEFDGSYTPANDPLINRSEESLPLDKELQKITEAESEQPMEIAPVKINTGSLNSELKKSLTELNLSQAQFQSANQLQAQSPTQIQTSSQPLVSVKEIKTLETPAVVKQEVKPVVAEKTQETPEFASTEKIPEMPISGAEIGQCYGKVKIAGTFKEVTEQVVVDPAKTKTEIIPAKYEYRNEEVVVKEESYNYVQIPATYKAVTEQVVIEPEKKELVTIPAVYKTIQERVMVKPAQKVWKKGRGLIEKAGDDGEIMCLREEPAVYETVSKQVLVTPERTETKIVPAVTKVINKQVVDQPARSEKVLVPAVKNIVQKKVIVEPQQTRTINIPAVEKTVRKKVQLTEDRVDWAQIVCNDNLRPGLVAQIQSALALKGYSVAQDGIFGKTTADALDKYQKSLGYESSGIALQTLKELGIAN